MNEEFLISQGIVNGKEQRIYRFPNDYGAIVTKLREEDHYHKMKAYYVAVIKFIGPSNNAFEYDPAVDGSPDVRGWFDAKQVNLSLRMIKRKNLTRLRLNPLSKRNIEVDK